MERPLVVGYKGEIGSFILSGLLRILPKAVNIMCVDVYDTLTDTAERIKKADTIFLCVPMKDTVKWLVDNKALVGDTLVIEQCSLKRWIYEDERVNGMNIKSMHILFRPSQTPNLEDRRVGLLDSQITQKPPLSLQEVVAITQATPVGYLGADHHDREMAIQQALVHRTLLVLGETLRGCTAFSYVGEKVIELDIRIRGGDHDLYAAIQDNEHIERYAAEFIEKLKQFKIEDYMQ